MLNVKNSVLLWNPKTAEVALVAKPLSGLGRCYARSGLGCYAETQSMTFEQRKTQVFIEAMHLIVRDGCDPQAVHQALCGLEEYQAGLSEDMPGAQR